MFLTDDITFAGEILAKLNIASTLLTQILPKLIDVYPEDFKPAEKKRRRNLRKLPPNGKKRNNACKIQKFERKQKLTTGIKTAVTPKLQDVVHTFKKGHKIQIQIFFDLALLFAVNPQKIHGKPELGNQSRLHQSIH